MWYFTFDQSLPHSYGLEVQKHKWLESNWDPLRTKLSDFSSSFSVTPVLKKLIHFLTHKERPDFDGPKSKIAQNCPNFNFAFDRKIPNSKMTP